MVGDPKLVYVVDDDPLVCRTITEFLEPNGYGVSAFGSGQAFLDDVSSLARGCLLLDVRMPDMSGLEVLEALSSNSLDFPTIMISGYGDVSTAVKAVKAGAADFVEKPFTSAQLLEAIEAVEKTSAKPSLKDTPLGVVTAREMEVIRHLVEGDPNKVVAFKLGISERTVEVHRAKIMSRLEIKTFAELVRIAVKSGL